MSVSRLSFIIVAILCLAGSNYSQGTEPSDSFEPNIGDFIQECQRSAKGDALGIVWWLPVEYWEIALKNDPSGTPETIANITKTLKPYQLFFVAYGKLGPFGGADLASREELLQVVRLQVNGNVILQPLADHEVMVDAQNLVGAMAPVFANLIGDLGKGLHPVFFDAAPDDSTRSFSATGNSSFAVSIGDQRFEWNLPLESLIAKQECEKCGAVCSGTWSYCPYCGKKLKK